MKLTNGSVSDEACEPLKLRLTVEDPHLRRFFEFLQRGFCMKAQAGSNLRSFLCGQLGVKSEYVMDRISTVFLNGSPVDDLDAAVLCEGSRISLSAAMPGLVGAAMRRGGHYASFRDSITHKADDVLPGSGACLVRLKLFNLVMEELGPPLLREGVMVEMSELTDFFSRQSEEFPHACTLILINGIPVTPAGLKGALSVHHGDRKVYLSVRTVSR